MSGIIPIGIDFGTINTRVAKFDIVQLDYAKSKPTSQLNANGSKETP